VNTEDARPVDPSTLEPLGHVAASTPAQIDEAAAAAAQALRGRWSRDSRLRATVLAEWAAALRAETESLVTALVAETGKPAAEARVEVAGAVDALSYNAGLARHISGRAGQLPDGNIAHLVREPVGVTAFIVPWNWPVLLLFRDLAPALAAGVTALVKPATQTTLVTRRVLEIGVDAGLPPEVVRLVVGDVRAGQAVVEHPLVRAVAFTGSTAVGAQIMKQAAGGMKRTLLELGGKGVAAVFADADLDLAVRTLASAAVITTGQMCMACTRILVQREVFDETVDRLHAALSGFAVGDPRKPDTVVGPLISARQRERVESFVDQARTRGTVIGGERVQPDGLPGHFMTPALVTGVPVDSPVVQEDIFGPVVTVEPFTDERDAIALANATPFGLAASVWTADVHTAWRVSRDVEAGTVWVNGYNRSYPEMPSGGYKSSGVGRTRGIEGLEQFTEIKHVHFSVPERTAEDMT
jgi:betaine-aldehyde dehydrogenase